MKTRKLLALLLAGIMLFAFAAACAPNEDDDTTPDTQDTQTPDAQDPTDDTPAPTPTAFDFDPFNPPAGFEALDPNGTYTVSVLNYFSLANAGAMEELENVWDTFSAAFPNIIIERQDAFEDEFHVATETHAIAGTLPDVISGWPTARSTTLHRDELLMDLAPLIANDSADFQNFVSAALDPANQFGNRLGIIPRGYTTTHVMIANLEVLNSAGLQPATTFSELVEQAPILAEAGYETILMANEAGSAWKMQSCLFSLITGRFLGAGWEDRILSGELSFDGPEFTAALELVEEMYATGVIDQSTLAVVYDDGPPTFARGESAYFIDGDWRISSFITDADTGHALIDTERQENMQIMVFPEIDRPGVAIPARTNTSVPATGWGLNADLEGAQLTAAWTLLRWLTSRDTFTFLVGSGALPVPSRTDIDFSAIALEPIQESLAGLGDLADVSTVVIDGVFPSDVHVPLNDGLQAIGLGTQTPAQVAAAVQAAFVSWQAAEADGGGDDNGEEADDEDEDEAA